MWHHVVALLAPYVPKETFSRSSRGASGEDQNPHVTISCISFCNYFPSLNSVDLINISRKIRVVVGFYFVNVHCFFVCAFARVEWILCDF